MLDYLLYGALALIGFFAGVGCMLWVVAGQEARKSLDQMEE